MKGHFHAQFFVCGVWGSNSRPHRCMTSTLQVDLYKNTDKRQVYVICVIHYRLYMLLNLLVKALMSWISNSHLQFTLVVLRGKNVECPQRLCHPCADLHLSMLCFFQTCSYGNIYDFFLLFYTIVGHNDPFYSVTFSDIQWWSELKFRMKAQTSVAVSESTWNC